MKRIARQSQRRIFAVPAILAIASVAGLVLALTGDGWRDWLSILLLALALGLAARAWARRN